jgi:hypothetical protein
MKTILSDVVDLYHQDAHSFLPRPFKLLAWFPSSVGGAAKSMEESFKIERSPSSGVFQFFKYKVLYVANPTREMYHGVFPGCFA